MMRGSYPFDTLCRPYRYKKKKKQNSDVEGEGEREKEENLKSRASLSARHVTPATAEPPQGWGTGERAEPPNACRSAHWGGVSTIQQMGAPE